MPTIIENGIGFFREDWDASRALRDSMGGFDAWYAGKRKHEATFVGPRHPVIARDQQDPRDTSVQSTEHDFGVRDPKGRAVGANVNRCTRVYSIQEARTMDSGNDYPEAGVFFVWVGNATRAGSYFGASQSANYCTSEAEREAAIAKYLKGAKARALKQFGEKAAA